MMQNLISTEAVASVEGDASKTKSNTSTQGRTLDDDLKDNDKRQTNSSPRQESGKREDSSKVVVDLEGLAVSSSQGTELFSLIAKRNWLDTVKRCKGEQGMKEAMTWIVEKNADDSTRWKLLPIHQVSI